MMTLWHDVKYGLRQLRRKPGFAAVAVLVLGLGIGACTAVFSVANTLLFRPLPYDDPERLVALGTWTSGNHWNPFLPIETLDALTAQTTCFENMTVFRFTTIHITGGEYAEEVRGHLVSPNIFDVLGIEPVLGRPFLPDEGQPGRDNVAVISHHLWQRRFGGDPDLIGKTIPLAHLYSGGDLEKERLYTVVGIMPPGLRFYFDYFQADVWQPLDLRRLDSHLEPEVIARLKSGMTHVQVQAQVDTFSQRLAQQASESKDQKRIIAQSLRNQVEPPSMRRSLRLLAGAAVFVLLIACANVANMLLTRAIGREKEVAMRTILGAGRRRLLRQLLTEGLLLSTLGTCLGVLLACWGVDLLTPLIPSAFAPWCSDIKMNWSMLGCASVFLLVIGIGFGLTSALQLCRSNLMGAVKEGGTRSESGSNRRPLRSLLVVTQMALTLVLLIGAGLMIRTVRETLRVDLGFDPRNLVQFEVTLPLARDSGYTGSSQRTLFFDRALEQIAAVPGVQSVGVLGDSIHKCTSEEQTEPKHVSIYPCSVGTHDYLGTMGVRLVQGRRFTEQEEMGQANSILINDVTARQFWPDGDPLGKTLQVQVDSPSRRNPNPPPVTCQVVGVVKAPRVWDYTGTPRGGVYMPWKAWDRLKYPASTGTSMVRSAGDPAALVRTIRQTIGALDGRLPVAEVVVLEDRLRESTSKDRLYMRLFSVFGVLGLVLAAVGIYGVISYSVAQRTHEIGVRVALGARHNDVLRLMLKKGLVLILVGLVAGLGGAMAMTRVIAGLLYGVTATDPWTYAAVSLLTAGAGLAACYLPARRAARIDPMAALRCE